MLEAVLSKVGEKGRLVIPVQFREALGMKAGDTVVMEMVDGQICLSTFASRVKRSRERVKKYTTPGKSLVDTLIADRREEVRREEQESEKRSHLLVGKRG